MTSQNERVQDRLPQPSLEVQRIYVREEFKRRGLGAMLMRLARSPCVRRACRCC